MSGGTAERQSGRAAERWTANRRLYRSTVPPFHRSTVPPFHRSTVPPFHRSAVPPFHRSTVPPFHRPTVPPFHRSPALTFVDDSRPSPRRLRAGRLERTRGPSPEAGAVCAAAGSGSVGRPPASDSGKRDDLVADDGQRHQALGALR